jgi:hypothetical protein
MNKYLKIRRLIFNCFLISACLASSCRKKDDPKPENLGFYSLGETKDYLLFKQGSYWVYENTLNKELDSMVLTYCHLDTIHEKGKKREYDFEVIDYRIVSHRDNAFYIYSCYGPNPESTDFYFGWTFICERYHGFRDSFYGNSSGSGSAVQFYYPFDKDRVRGSMSGAKTTFIERFDSMIVRSKTYYKIVTFSVNPDYTFPYPNMDVGNYSSSKYYWAKNIGIIKIEIESWDIKTQKTTYYNWELLKSYIKF